MAKVKNILEMFGKSVDDKLFRETAEGLNYAFSKDGSTILGNSSKRSIFKNVSEELKKSRAAARNFEENIVKHSPNEGMKDGLKEAHEKLKQQRLDASFKKNANSNFSADELRILRQDQLSRTANNKIVGTGFNQQELIRHSPVVENANTSNLNKNQGIFNNRVHNSRTTSSSSADVLMSENKINDLANTSAFADEGAMAKYNKKHNMANISESEFRNQNKLKEELLEKHGQEKLNKKINDKSAGAAATQKDNFGKMDSFLKKAVPIAVGGGLVFSMFNRGGQMSNSELYGQQQQYGGGQGY